MTQIEKIISALENCTAEEKCKDCPWEECEHEHKTVKLPFGLVMNVIALLRHYECFKAILEHFVEWDNKP